MSDRDWTVLLIGGHSGSGKTVVAERIGLKLGVPWIMADDLRLAFQRSRALLPTDGDALYFDKSPDYWRRPAEEQRDSLIAVGEAMSLALEVVVENHVDQSAPCIVEGADLLPSLLSRPPVRERREAVRAVFLVEPDESAILAAVVERGREFAGRCGRRPGGGGPRPMAVRPVAGAGGRALRAAGGAAPSVGYAGGTGPEAGDVVGPSRTGAYSFAIRSSAGQRSSWSTPWVRYTPTASAPFASATRAPSTSRSGSWKLPGW